MASRRKSRELALQMLYQWEVGHHPPAHVVATFLEPQKKDEAAANFARQLFEGTVEGIPDLDALLRQHSTHWRLERMATIDRNVLRLALYELMRHPETPRAVVLNEAIDIARRFSGEDSAQFVNGVLDAVRKSLPFSKPPEDPQALGSETSPRPKKKRAKREKK